MAWGVIQALLRNRQLYFHRLGPIGARLARRAFTIYAVHPPVVVAVTLAWRGVVAPVLLKFALHSSVACLPCYFLASQLLRFPGVDQVL